MFGKLCRFPIVVDAVISISYTLLAVSPFNVYIVMSFEILLLIRVQVSSPCIRYLNWYVTNNNIFHDTSIEVELTDKVSNTGGSGVPEKKNVLKLTGKNM